MKASSQVHHEHSSDCEFMFTQLRPTDGSSIPSAGSSAPSTPGRDNSPRSSGASSERCATWQTATPRPPRGTCSAAPPSVWPQPSTCHSSASRLSTCHSSAYEYDVGYAYPADEFDADASTAEEESLYDDDAAAGVVGRDSRRAPGPVGVGGEGRSWAGGERPSSDRGSFPQPL